MSTVSPQGYQIETNPVNNNPFWEYEIEGAGLKSITCVKTTQGDYDYYAWSYTDADDISHHVMTQVVSTKAGIDGVTFTPSVSEQGVISWTNDGNLPNPEPVNIRGPQGIQGIQGIQGPAGPAGATGATGQRGPQGIQGQPGTPGLDGVSPEITVTDITGGHRLTIVDAAGTHNIDIMDGTNGTAGQDGAAATIEIGQVATGAAGTNANVRNSGTTSAAVLDFVIPRGDTGAAGQTGPAGADGYSPAVDIQTIAGGHSITITDEDHPTGQTFNVMDGQDGMGTVQVGTTTTGQPGTAASVTNSGTAQNAVLDFVLPAGATGATGATGPQGPTGPAGADGADGVSPTITVSQTATGYHITITDVSGTDYVDLYNGADGTDGVGVPSGGTAGQVLAKASGTDYDTEWVTPSGGGGGGTPVEIAGQSFTQASSVGMWVKNKSTSQYIPYSSIKKFRSISVTLLDTVGYEGRSWEFVTGASYLNGTNRLTIPADCLDGNQHAIQHTIWFNYNNKTYTATITFLVRCYASYNGTAVIEIYTMNVNTNGEIMYSGGTFSMADNYYIPCSFEFNSSGNYVEV